MDKRQKAIAIAQALIDEGCATIKACADYGAHLNDPLTFKEIVNCLRHGRVRNIRGNVMAKRRLEYCTVLSQILEASKMRIALLVATPLSPPEGSIAVIPDGTQAAPVNSEEGKAAMREMAQRLEETLREDEDGQSWNA